MPNQLALLQQAPAAIVEKLRAAGVDYPGAAREIRLIGAGSAP